MRVCTAGTSVAVKVRHPGVGTLIQRDFALMLWGARLAGMLPGVRHLRLEDSLKQFAAPLREQVRRRIAKLPALGLACCEVHAKGAAVPLQCLRQLHQPEVMDMV